VIPAIALMAILAQQPYVGSGGPRRGSTEFSAAAAWTGGYDAGSAAALETRNTSTGTGPLTLFNTTGEVSSGSGIEGRIGYFVAPRLSVEAVFQYTRPVLRAQLSDDFENAPALTAEETISSYLIGGSLLYHFGTGRFTPFVLGGAGYLMQLHEGGAEKATGAEIHGGGGFRYWFSESGRRFGLRVEALASSRSKSVGFEDTRGIVPTLTAGISFLF
jgi:opacity protein-like surface antigen